MYGDIERQRPLDVSARALQRQEEAEGSGPDEPAAGRSPDKSIM